MLNECFFSFDSLVLADMFVEHQEMELSEEEVSRISGKSKLKTQVKVGCLWCQIQDYIVLSWFCQSYISYNHTVFKYKETHFLFSPVAKTGLSAVCAAAGTFPCFGTDLLCSYPTHSQNHPGKLAFTKPVPPVWKWGCGRCHSATEGAAWAHGYVIKIDFTVIFVFCFCLW